MRTSTSRAPCCWPSEHAAAALLRCGRTGGCAPGLAPGRALLALHGAQPPANCRFPCLRSSAATSSHWATLVSSTALMRAARWLTHTSSRVRLAGSATTLRCCRWSRTTSSAGCTASIWSWTASQSSTGCVVVPAAGRAALPCAALLRRYSLPLSGALRCKRADAARVASRRPCGSCCSLCLPPECARVPACAARVPPAARSRHARPRARLHPLLAPIARCTSCMAGRTAS